MKWLGSGMWAITVLLFMLFLLASCARQEDPLVAQIRLRKMQSRTYVGHNAKGLIKEVMAILQDEGYMVKNVSTDIGLITAECDTNIEKFSSKFWAYLFSGRKARWKKHSVVELTANITEEENQSKIRVNYLVRVFDNRGRVVDVHQVLEDEVYLAFFNKIQRGLLKQAAF